MLSSPYMPLTPQQILLRNMLERGKITPDQVQAMGGDVSRGTNPAQAMAPTPPMGPVARPGAVPPFPRSSSGGVGGFLSGLLPQGGEFKARLGDLLAGLGSGRTMNDGWANANQALLAGKQSRAATNAAMAEENRTRQAAIQMGIPPEVAMSLDGRTLMGLISDQYKTAMMPPDPLKQADLELKKLEIEQKKHPKPDELKTVTLASPDGKLRRSFSVTDPLALEYVNKRGWIDVNAIPKETADTKPAAIQEYEYAKAQGFPGSFADWEASKKGGMSLQVDPSTGEVSFQQGGNIKPLTESQSKDTSYATRAEGALNDFEPVANSLTSLGETAGGSVPYVGNYLKSEPFQQAERAGNDFLTALLRKESGATIRDEEQRSYGDIFLPRPGDKPGTLEQKKQARLRALEGIKAGMTPQAILMQEKALKNSTIVAPGKTDAEPPASGAVVPYTEYFK